MVFDRFHTGIIIRAISVAALSGFFVFALCQDQWYVTSAASGILAIALIFELIRFSGQSEKHLALLLTMLKQKDFSSRWKEDLSLKDYNINNALSRIIEEFENVQIEKEVHYNYLRVIVEHISVALICYDSEGNIKLFNNAARNLYGVANVKSLKSLSTTDPELPGLLFDISAGEQKVRKTFTGKEFRHLLIKCTGIRLQSQALKLVSVQDIQSELEEKEVESWQKLIRVLTHEIMNSVTPISSLSESINEMLGSGSGQGNVAELDKAERTDLVISMKSIENRSKGLLAFLESYKKLSRLPGPDLASVKIISLLGEVVSLMKPSLEKAGIAIDVGSVEDDLVIMADMQQIAQVLINLIKNSIDSVAGNYNGRISIISKKNHENRVLIQVSDNGYGIEQEIIEEIFIPFYTTKRKGNGIGLSISRQIMRLHRGRIYVQSIPGVETTFTLEF